MNVSADAPYFDMAYKIVTYAGRNVLKLSAGKTTWTGEKQIFRFRGPDGSMAGDVLALHDEPAPAGAEPLLRTVMRGGELMEPLPSLAVIRDYARAQIAALPDAVRRLHDPAAYEVRYSERLRSTQRALEAETHAAEVGNVLADAGHAGG
jgi:nicotinate phosphoribosyltransferase